MKKFLCVVLVLALTVGCLFAFTACGNETKYDKELINNGSFEASSSSAAYWQQEKAVSNDSDGKLNLLGYGGESDEYYLTVANSGNTGNFVKLYQKVEVKRNAVYKITAKVKNLTIKQGANDKVAGAGIGIIEGEKTLMQYSEVTSDWTEITAYIKPKNTDTVTVALLFGNKDAQTIGTVAFDDVSMVRVKAADVPADETVVSIRAARVPKYSNSSLGATLLVIFLAIVTVCIIVGFYFAYRKLMADDKPIFAKTWLTAGIIAILAIALRLILAGTLFDAGKTAYTLSTLREMVDHGGSRVIFNHTDLTPFQAYYYWVCGKIVYGWTSLGAVNVIVSLFPIICEGVTVAMIYFFAKKYLNDKQSALFAALYAFLPVSFIASAGYSVEIPVLTMLLLLTFYALIEKDYLVLLAGSLVTCLWSTIGIYVLPFIVAYEIYIMVKTKDKKIITTFCVGYFVSFWLFLFLSAPAVKEMFAAGHIVYVFKCYYLAMFNSQVCVSNAFNLYALFGLNGGAVNNAAFWLNIVFSVILVIYSVSLYFKNFNRAEMILCASFFLSVMAVFSLNMDEMALSLGLITLLMYIIVSGEHRLFWVFGALAFMAFVNMGIVLDYNGALSETYKVVYFNKGDAGYAIANVLSACVVLFYGWTVYDITTNGNKKFIPPLTTLNVYSKTPVAKED